MSERKSTSWPVTIGGLRFTVWVAENPPGNVVELRMTGLRGHGKSLEAMLTCLCEAISVGLSNGKVPLQNYVKTFRGRVDEIGGKVEGDPYVTECGSIMDYLSKTLEARYLKQKA